VTQSDLSIAEVATTTSETSKYMGHRFDSRPLGKRWWVLIDPPGTDALWEYASDIEK
jgi:hypothetical protein